MIKKYQFWPEEFLFSFFNIVGGQKNIFGQKSVFTSHLYNKKEKDFIWYKI